MQVVKGIVWVETNVGVMRELEPRKNVKRHIPDSGTSPEGFGRPWLLEDIFVRIVKIVLVLI